MHNKLSERHLPQSAARVQEISSILIVTKPSIIESIALLRACTQKHDKNSLGILIYPNLTEESERPSRINLWLINITQPDQCPHEMQTTLSYI
jgi:hypothetical protein